MKFEPPLFHPNSKSFVIRHPDRGTQLIYPRVYRCNRHSAHCSEFIHGNPSPLVYPDGTVCISILHTPGDDPTMYEQASERWSPVQSVEKVILSVISMLAGASCFCALCAHPSRCSVHTKLTHYCLRLPSPRRAEPREWRQYRLLQAIQGQQSGLSGVLVSVWQRLICAISIVTSVVQEYERIVRQSIKEQLGL